MFSFSDENVEASDITNDKRNSGNDFFDELYEEIMHDLMSSINIILLGENIISKKISKETTEIIGKYLRAIRFNSYRIINLANSLNNAFNLNMIQDEDDFITFNLVEVIENLVISFTPYIEKKSINLEFIKDVNSIDMHSNIKDIDRIISNLVYNAIKYTDENGNIKIALNIPEEKCIEVIVEDDGIGIKEEDLSRVFLRKEKVDENSDGQGIGLYIAKEKAKALGGDIKVESTLEKGSKFILTLPLK